MVHWRFISRAVTAFAAPLAISQMIKTAFAWKNGFRTFPAQSIIQEVIYK